MLRVPAAKAPCTNGAESAMAAGAKAAVLRTLRRVSGLGAMRSEEHTSELQSQSNLVCRLLLEKKKQTLPGPLDCQSYIEYRMILLSSSTLQSIAVIYLNTAISDFFTICLSVFFHVHRCMPSL